MSLARQSLRNAVFSAIAVIWPLLLFLVSTPYVVGKLGDKLYGVWVLVNTIMGLLGVANLNIGEATIKYVAEYHARGELERVNDVVGLSLLFYIGVGLAVWGSISALAPWLASEVFSIEAGQVDMVSRVLRLGALGFFLTMTTSAVSQIPTALQRYDWASTMELVYRTTLVLAYIVLLYLGFSLTSLVMATVAVSGLRMIAFALISYRLVPGLRLRPALHKKTARQVFGFSIFTTMNALGGRAVAQIDRLVIGAFVGASGLTYYSVPNSIAMRIHGLLASMSNFLFPMASSLSATDQGERLYRTFVLMSKAIMLLAVACALPLALGARPLLTFWMGAGFAERSARVLQIQAFSYLLAAMLCAPYYLLNGIGRPQVNGYFALTTAVMLTILCLLLVPSYGIVGAAVAFLTWYCISVPVYFGLVQRMVFRRPVVDLVWAFLPPAGLALLSVGVVDKFMFHLGDSKDVLTLLMGMAGYAILAIGAGTLADHWISPNLSIWSVLQRLLREFKVVRKARMV